MRKTLEGSKISLYGSKANIDLESKIIDSLPLTGNEGTDRLIIQKCIDDHKFKSSVLYGGNTVYPFEKTVKEYRRLQKDGTLTKMSNYMYSFFMNGCDDIAHYNIDGYRAYYNNSFRKLEEELLPHCFSSTWHTDLDKIHKELKIGRNYYKERDSIDIDKVPLNKLKNIIKDCGWNVKEVKDNYWNLSINIDNNINYDFNLDILNHDVSRIIRDINYIANSFDNNYYIQDMIAKKENVDNPPNYTQLVSIATTIKYKLNQLPSNVLYKTRIVAENILNSMKSKNQNIDLDLELER